MKISDLVFENIAPLFTGDIKLVEVEYVKKSDGMHLVVYIDKATGITIDDCVAVNDLINDKLEELNPTNDESYCLDVSSYGLDKPLKFDWQFKKYLNKLVDVKLYRKVNGLKEFTATLLARDENQTQFNLNEENFSINNEEIAYILPYIDFKD